MSYDPGSAGIKTRLAGARAPRLLDDVRGRLRFKRYSLRTEQTYVGWIRRFILANGKRHPREMGAAEVERFLSDLAVRRDVAASTQNQALSALLFLYRDVLGIELPWMENVVRAKRPRRLPVVLSQEEVRRLLAAMDGRPWLLASLLYGTGMRLMECLRLRVKDVDFARDEITIRDGKGGKDRRTMLPRSLVEPLQREIERARCLHQQDLSDGYGATRLPHALPASTRGLHVNLPGNSCSRQSAVRSIRWMAPNVGTTSTMRCWHGHSNAHAAEQTPRSQSARTRCDIPLPRT